MRLMKFMVTGSSGFVGSHIVDALENQFSPSDISLIVRDPKKVNARVESGMTVFKADITDSKSISHLLREEPYRPEDEEMSSQKNADLLTSPTDE